MGRVSPVSQSTMRLSADLSSRAWLLLPFAFVASLLLGYGVIGLLLWGCESCVSYFIFQPDRTLYAKRSEEHTSELQSRLHLVCRLLLEKKKKKNICG